MEKEIGHLKNYVYIMNERMHDDVHYIYEIEPGTEQARIPRLSLQPLVENALNHGLKNQVGPKQVRICCQTQGDNLVIKVADNGVGMDAEAMNRRLETEDPRSATTGKAIGLSNINARLKLLWSSSYGLRVESAPGAGTTVIMTLPGKEAETVNA